MRRRVHAASAALSYRPAFEKRALSRCAGRSSLGDGGTGRGGGSGHAFEAVCRDDSRRRVPAGEVDVGGSRHTRLPRVALPGDRDPVYESA